jgi:hypothetical protein
MAFLLLVFVFRRDAVNRMGGALFAVALLGFVVSRMSIFKEGVNVMTTRFNEVAEQTQESVAHGIVSRVFSELTDSAYIWTKAPWFGYGLGIGTNAGANILTGQSVFLLTEGEWPRIELESGRIFGVAYIIWRILFTGYVGFLCIRALKSGNLLPIFLFSAGFVSMFNGQFGQPTILGFAIMTFGLTMAAMKTSEADEVIAPIKADLPVRAVPRSRSVYASRLHGPPAGSGTSNGSGHH